MIYEKPEIAKDSFTCVACGVLTQQKWSYTRWSGEGAYSRLETSNKISISECTRCKAKTLWANGKMLYPESGNAPYPNIDMPESVKELYTEAASIYSKSPRGAAAILRLGIQLLCKELGEKGKNIDDDIASLVKKGLSPIVQQSLDAVRVIGNEAVHPGTIDTDNTDVVMQLFEAMNLIIDYTITMPNKSKRLYASLPKGKLEHINERDK